MGSNEHGITNAQWMLGAAPQHGLLHDQNIRTDHYRAEIATDNSTGQNSRSWTDCHVTGQHGGWCYPGRGIDHSGHRPRVTNGRTGTSNEPLLPRSSTTQLQLLSADEIGYPHVTR